jgi:ring-1,2-phenylacetyl-CoA epoxidase subunit PaaD
MVAQRIDQPPDRPAIEEVWDWLRAVPDPEVPVVSVVDLGIVRDVRWEPAAEGDELVVTITPTYSGCPATQLIEEEIVAALRAQGITLLRMETRLSPAWTTDWLSDAAKEKLREFGIAPPAQQVIAIQSIGRGQTEPPTVSCPRCGLTHTRLTSWFGSTPCKAMYQCSECLEPFDYFKSH